MDQDKDLDETHQMKELLLEVLRLQKLVLHRLEKIEDALGRKGS